MHKYLKILLIFVRQLSYRGDRNMPVINFRVTEAERQKLEILSSGNISGYIKQRLFGNTIEDNSGEIMAALHEVIDSNLNADRRQSNNPILIEILLLLRTVVKPELRREVASELKRQQISSWNFDQ